MSTTKEILTAKKAHIEAVIKRLEADKGANANAIETRKAHLAEVIAALSNPPKTP